MSEKEFTTIARWIVVFLFIGVFLFIAPPLVSAASDKLVILGFMLCGGSALAIAYTLTKRADTHIRALYWMLYDAFK